MKRGINGRLWRTGMALSVRGGGGVGMWESGQLDAMGRRLFVSLWMRRKWWRGELNFLFIYSSVIAVSRGLFNSNHRPRSLA